MNLLIKSLLALSLLFSISALPVTSYAGVTSKIKNATEEEVRQALLGTIKATEDAISALKAGAEDAVVQEHIKLARQLVKRVEINRLDVIRTRSSEKLKSARQALNKNDKAQAEEFLTIALKGYQEMARQF